LQTNILFGSGNERLGTMLFTGNIIVIMMVISYKHTIDLLFDLEHGRFIDYQLMLLNPRLLILERIIFAGFYTCIFSLPFFPVAKICLGSYLETTHTSWLQVIFVIFVGSLCCAAYHQTAALMLKRSNQISTLWARINHILINFGGFWIPLYIFREYSPILGYAVYINPFLYITEGLRRAVLASDEFLSVWLCIGMLAGFTILFIVASWYLFKKRVDHI
jgi:ABC-type multidrug transport system permease subunit